METVLLISNAVSLLQGIIALTDAADQVSKIVAKRLAEGRQNWTPQEEQQILDMVNKNRAAAVEAVAALPDSEPGK